MNIIANAIDALETGNALRPASEITICTSVIDAKWVQIAIADNGCGISKQIQSRIFDPFFTTKSTGKGTGMGLSISYQIITETHQGKLEVRSAPEKGTEFVIQIPMHQQIHEVASV